MARLIRCDRCKSESDPDRTRTIKLPLYWTNSMDTANEFDNKTVDLCFDCGRSLVAWFENWK